MFERTDMKLAAGLAAAAGLVVLIFEPVASSILRWTITAALAALALVALDVARFRKLDVHTPFETKLGRWLLSISATAAAATVAAARFDPELYAFLIFCGGFGLFGAVFRFAVGRPNVGPTAAGRKAKRDAKLTGEIGWRDGRIEEIAAGGRISPWPGRGLLATGGLLILTGALGIGLAAYIGLAFALFGGALVVARHRSMPFGVSVVAPDETPIRLKRGMQGALRIPKRPQGPIALRLSCVERRVERVETGGEARRVGLETLWEEDAELVGDRFEFAPPEDLPSSSAHGDVRVSWTLTASAPGYRAVFRLPVVCRTKKR